MNIAITFTCILVLLSLVCVSTKSNHKRQNKKVYHKEVLREDANPEDMEEVERKELLSAIKMLSKSNAKLINQFLEYLERQDSDENTVENKLSNVAKEEISTHGSIEQKVALEAHAVEPVKIPADMPTTTTEAETEAPKSNLSTAEKGPGSSSTGDGGATLTDVGKAKNKISPAPKWSRHKW